MEEIDVNRSLLQEDLFVLFKNQLKKDFESAGVNPDFTSQLPSQLDALNTRIIAVLDPLVHHHSSLLSSLLYRVDISEQQLQKYQAANKTLSFVEVMSELIIKRVLQKVILKKTFSVATHQTMPASIRIGTEKDLPQALELIKELAAFENAPNEVEVTVDEMKSQGFGTNKLFDFFVLEKEAKIIGIALYYYKYSTWKGRCLFLEDIIVTERERKKGYGKLLFNAVVSVAKEQRARRMEWQVLDWNEPAIEFYKKYRSNFDGEWLNCKLTFDQLQGM